MGRIATLQRRLRKAAGVPRVARALQSVHNEKVRFRSLSRKLGMNQNLNAGFSLEETRLYWKAASIERPRPEISRDGGEMGI